MTSSDERLPLTDEQKERIKKTAAPFLNLLTTVKKYELEVMKVSLSVVSGEAIDVAKVYDTLYVAEQGYLAAHSKAVTHIDDLLFLLSGDSMKGKDRDGFRMRQNLRRRREREAREKKS